MRNAVIALTIIAFALMLLGLFTPVLGEIALYILVMAFAIVATEIGRATLPGKGGR